MENLQSVKELVQSQEYNVILEKVRKYKEVDEEIWTGGLDQNIKRLYKAELSAKELHNLMESDTEELAKYALLRSKGKINFEQEYPENEEPDPDDEDEIVAILPPNKDFLLSFFIEYFVIKNKSNELLAYLKALRIPKASEEANLLRELYHKSIS
ncbi:hypothetical protein ACIQ57_21675 [Lysinibacillus xylanilyticus]|uniref:hypothetical protein n=1 Tax=Lysinibacillus xylanilyticus TaxID=582475 RepID=UPI00381046BF